MPVVAHVGGFPLEELVAAVLPAAAALAAAARIVVYRMRRASLRKP